MIFKTFGDFTIGFHYSRITVLNTSEFKGNEYGSNYSVEELQKFSFATVSMIENFIKLFDKMGDSLSAECSNLHVSQFDDYYSVAYKEDVMNIPKSFVLWAKEDLKSPNGELNGAKFVEEEMQNKAKIYYDRYPAIKNLDIEDVLLFVDSGQEYRLENYIAV